MAWHGGYGATERDLEWLRQIVGAPPPGSPPHEVLLPLLKAVVKEGEAAPGDMTCTISLQEWLNAKTAYSTISTALCDIGLANNLADAKKIAAAARASTPPSL